MKKYNKVLDFLPFIAILMMIIVIIICLGIILNEFIIMIFSLVPLLIFVVMLLHYSYKNEKETNKERDRFYV
ncbi:MAG: hypothetical protein ACTSPD_20950 [Promethearchaeota archaeon]